MKELEYDAVVIGTGFGGLGAALTLAEAGLRVGVLEAVNYPGGCASTFRRRDYRFESGATLFSGFSEGMYFDQLIKRYNMPVEIDWIDPLVEVRSETWNLKVSRSRDKLHEDLVALGVPDKNLRAFFDEQRRIADVLWQLFDTPDLLPPWNLRSLAVHATRLPRYAKLLKVVGRSLFDVLKRHGLDKSEPLVTFLNALCQITIQTSVREAEAPFAMATMDYYFRGTAHVRDGIGSLANSMVKAIETSGGDVHFTTRVKSAQREANMWHLHTNKYLVRSKYVFGNLLPHAAEALIHGSTVSDLSATKRDLDDGWGAAMLYLAVEHHQELPEKALHIEAIGDPGQPLIEGNHIFASLSGLADRNRAPAGQRTLTVSTHVPMSKFLKLDPSEQGAYIASIQDAMFETLNTRAPEMTRSIVMKMTASPRTFERFTKRPLGRVGGIPRKVGLHHYLRMMPLEVAPGFTLVGDSAFPGQSTLACAIGGQRAATKLLRTLKLKALGTNSPPELTPHSSAPQHSP